MFSPSPNPNFIRGAEVFLSERPSYPLEEKVELDDSFKIRSTLPGCKAAHMVFGVLPVFQDLCSRADFATPQLNRFMSSQLLFSSCLDTISNFYSDPEHEAITLEEANALLQVMALGGGIGRWLSSMNYQGDSTGKDLLSYGGSLIWSMRKKILRHTTLNKKGFYERPFPLVALFRELSDGHKAIALANAETCMMFQAQDSSLEPYIVQSMAVGAIISATMYHLTMYIAEQVESTGNTVMLVQPGSLQWKGSFGAELDDTGHIGLPCTGKFPFARYVRTYFVKTAAVLGVREAFALFDPSKKRKCGVV